MHKNAYLVVAICTSFSMALPAAAVSVPPPAPPSYVILPSPAKSPSNTYSLVTWTPGEVRCDGASISGEGLRRPLNGLIRTGSMHAKPESYAFAVDTSGRPLSITREGNAFAPTADDIAPALAASRFPSGARQQMCRVTYTPTLYPTSEAPIADLASYTITPTGVRLPREGWARLRADGTCSNKPRPAPLMRAFPDYETIPATPGVKDWALIAYDTDADGKPIGVRIAHTTRNAMLDEAAVKAVENSRFTGGARTGCLYPYWRAPATLDAPDKPDDEQFRPHDSTCSAKLNWATKPVTRYPQNYHRRAIEGWAILTYDVAPWGEVGNVKVVAAQPTADFGHQAAAILRTGRVAASAQGASGCVETVRFRMPARTKGVLTADADNEY